MENSKSTTGFDRSRGTLLILLMALRYIKISEYLCEVHIQALLNNSSIWSEVSIPHISNDGIMQDLNDGSYFKNHPLFVKFPNALQIVVYYDDLEVCNPLGSSAGVHKLGKFIIIIML